MKRLLLILSILFSLTAITPTIAQENVSNENPFSAYCPTYFTAEQCRCLGDTAMNELGKKINIAEVTEDLSLKQRLFQCGIVDAFMASPFAQSTLDKLPFETKFVVLDVEDADSVLAVEFNYKRSLHRETFGDEGENVNTYGFDLKLSGTVAQDDEENPRNLIDATVSFSFSSVPNFMALSAVSLLTDNLNCLSLEKLEDPTCIELIALGTKTFFKPIGPAFYTDYGLDVGYETDQSFDATNTKVSAFFSAVYEDLGRTSFFGKHGIVPSVRIAIDSVDPSSDTPRSLIGDTSSYERLSGEFHLNVPLITMLDIPYIFSFNYRTYNELSASDIVKQASLDKYRLRTFTISGPKGLFATYSSGRLPLGFKDEQVIGLGFKTYF